MWGPLLPLCNKKKKKKKVKEGGVFLPHPHEFLPPGSLNNAPLFSSSSPRSRSSLFPRRVVMEDKHVGNRCLEKEYALCVRRCGGGKKKKKKGREREREGFPTDMRVFVWVCLCVQGTSLWTLLWARRVWIRERHRRLSSFHLSCRTCFRLPRLFSRNPLWQRCLPYPAPCPQATE